MKAYIGAKIIQAEPMKESESLKEMGHFPLGPEEKDREGYRVVYPDGYVSWSPKDVFEQAYREVSQEEVSLILS